MSEVSDIPFKLINSNLIHSIFEECCSLVPEVTLADCEETEDSIFDSVKELEQGLSQIQSDYLVICENIEKLENGIDMIKKEVDEKKTCNKIKLRKKEDLERELAVLSKGSLSAEDQQLLETTRMRYKALRNMTQVIFLYDYCVNNRLQGFAFNKVKKEIKYFLIKNVSKLNEEEIHQHIVSHMEEACLANS